MRGMNSMSRLETGVKRYIHAKAELVISFPVDWKDREFIACEYCRLYSRSSGRCNWTSEVIPFPDKYTGIECPFEREDEENEHSAVTGE